MPSSSPLADRRVVHANSLAKHLKSSATMHFKFQSIFALAALVPLTIGSPLLRRAIPQNILSDLSAINKAANAATAAANALPNNATPKQIGVSRCCPKVYRFTL